MSKPEAIIFDFFGTLVDYSPSRTEQGYYRSHKLAESMGAELEYAEFLREWSAESALFDARSEVDDSEFSMQEVSGAFLSRILNRRPSRIEISALADSYVAEWNTGVVYPAPTRGIIESLAQRFRLAVVTNTHQPDLVPNHLVAMGIADRFETVVTSVEIGWRKPHPVIYEEVLRRLGITAGSAVFVGDNYTADYLGPKAAGMTAFLIDSSSHVDVPDFQRLHSLSDLPERLGSTGEVNR